MARGRQDVVRVLEDGALEFRTAGTRTWTPTTRTQLARDYPADHPIWVQLRAGGITRPSPSGRRIPNAERDRKLYTLRLLDDDARRLDELASRRGVCRSVLVATLVGEAEKREKPRKTG